MSLPFGIQSTWVSGSATQVITNVSPLLNENSVIYGLASSTGSNQNWLVSCYASSANGGSIIFVFSSDPTATNSGITIEWSVVSFEAGRPDNLHPALLVEFNPSKSAALAATVLGYTGTDYFLYNYTDLNDAYDTVAVNAQIRSSLPMVTQSSISPYRGYYFAFGLDIGSFSLMPLPVGSNLSVGIQQVSFGSGAVVTETTLNLPVNTDLQLYQLVKDTPAPQYAVYGATATVSDGGDVPPNFLIISGYVYGTAPSPPPLEGGGHSGLRVGVTAPPYSNLGEDGIGGARITLIPPNSGPPVPPIVVYQYGSWGVWGENDGTVQYPGRIVIPPSTALVNGSWRVIIEAGSCPTLASSPYNPDNFSYGFGNNDAPPLWIAQAKWSAPQVFNFDYQRFVPPSVADTPGVPQVKSQSGDTCHLEFDVTAALNDNNANPNLSYANQSFYVEAVPDGGGESIYSTNATEGLRRGLALCDIVLDPVTNYQLRSWADNGIGAVASAWVSYYTLPTSPLGPVALREASWSSTTNIARLSSSTPSGGAGQVSSKVFWTFTSPPDENSYPFGPGTMVNIGGGDIGYSVPPSRTYLNTDGGIPNGNPWTIYYKVVSTDSQGTVVSTTQLSANSSFTPPPNVQPTSPSTPQTSQAYQVASGTSWCIVVPPAQPFPQVGTVPVSYQGFLSYDSSDLGNNFIASNSFILPVTQVEPSPKGIVFAFPQADAIVAPDVPIYCATQASNSIGTITTSSVGEILNLFVPPFLFGVCLLEGNTVSYQVTQCPPAGAGIVYSVELAGGNDPPVFLNNLPTTDAGGLREATLPDNLVDGVYYNVRPRLVYNGADGTTGNTAVGAWLRFQYQYVPPNPGVPYLSGTPPNTGYFSGAFEFTPNLGTGGVYGLEVLDITVDDVLLVATATYGVSCLASFTDEEGQAAGLLPGTSYRVRSAFTPTGGAVVYSLDTLTWTTLALPTPGPVSLAAQAVNYNFVLATPLTGSPAVKSFQVDTTNTDGLVLSTISATQGIDNPLSYSCAIPVYPGSPLFGDTTYRGVTVMTFNDVEYRSVAAPFTTRPYPYGDATLNPTQAAGTNVFTVVATNGYQPTDFKAVGNPTWIMTAQVASHAAPATNWPLTGTFPNLTTTVTGQTPGNYYVQTFYKWKDSNGVSQATASVEILATLVAPPP